MDSIPHPQVVPRVSYLRRHPQFQSTTVFRGLSSKISDKDEVPMHRFRRSVRSLASAFSSGVPTLVPAFHLHHNCPISENNPTFFSPSIRFRANSQYSGDISIPINSRALRIAIFPVVPLPIKGSNTISPGLLHERM